MFLLLCTHTLCYHPSHRLLGIDGAAAILRSRAEKKKKHNNSSNNNNILNSNNTTSSNSSSCHNSKPTHPRALPLKRLDARLFQKIAITF